MRAVVCREFGPPEKLVIEEFDDPQAGPGEVVIDTRAVAVSFPDALIIEDRYQYKAEPPFVPGGEVAGVVSQLGEGVEGFALGDAVVGAQRGAGVTGGFAEKVLATAAAVRRMPEGLAFEQAAGLNYSYGTGWYALKYRGALKAGETLLVLGAAGNVGLAAVELGKLLGARVIAVASTAEKRALCIERGADEVIDYTSEDLKRRTKDLTDGQGADVVYDAVGGDHAEAALRATAWGGRFLVIGFTAGIPRIPLNLTLLKSCQIVGVFFGAMVGKEPETYQAIQRDLLDLVASGKLSPYVSKRYALEDAPQALRDLQERRATGKLVVTP
jgi:NADPH2:quinone reductase